MNNFAEWHTRRNTGFEIKWAFVDFNNRPVTVTSDNKSLAQEGYKKNLNKYDLFADIVIMYYTKNDHEIFMKTIKQLRMNMVRRNEQSLVKCDNNYQILDKTEIEETMRNLNYKLKHQKLNSSINYNITYGELENSAIFERYNC